MFSFVSLKYSLKLIIYCYIYFMVPNSKKIVEDTKRLVILTCYAYFQTFESDGRLNVYSIN